MWWFKSRPKQRKVAKREDRFTVEQLEQRLPPGNYWVPWTGIDITAIMPDAGIYVAGQIVEFSIVGSGEDWDKSVYQDGSNTPGELAQDTVWITWSGAFCVPVNGGKQAWCQLGSAGSPGIFRISMFAYDEAVMQPGDSGSRDDDDVGFTADVAAIWVTITPNFDGPMDDDDDLRFDYLEWQAKIDTQNPKDAGQTTPGPNSDGYFSKTELTGTISIPDNMADAKPGFDWVQLVNSMRCVEDRFGTWTRNGTTEGWHDDSPVDEGINKQTSPIHSKIFMIDSPGQEVGSGNDAGVDDYERVYGYQDFRTHVELNTIRASDDYPWHNIFKLVASTDANGNRSWVKEVETNIGAGPAPAMPADDCHFRP